VLVAPAGLKRASSLLGRARIKFRIEPIPTAQAIRAAQDERWLAELTADEEREVPERVQKQVERIVQSGLTERALAQLIINVRRATGEPREVTPLSAELSAGPRSYDKRGPRSFEQRPPRHPSAPPPSTRSEGYVPFRVSWGEAHGADARRLVAMLCRRGNIRGSDIGAIRVSRTSSTVDVAASVARGFAEATRQPDPRDPRVLVTPLHAAPPPGRERAPKPAREFSPKPAREFTPKPRDSAFRPGVDAPPKRPARKIVVNAPERRVPKKRK
jgi:ATP-dependent RNA helicase DeaD